MLNEFAAIAVPHVRWHMLTAENMCAKDGVVDVLVVDSHAVDLVRGFLKVRVRVMMESCRLCRLSAPFLFRPSAKTIHPHPHTLFLHCTRGGTGCRFAVSAFGSALVRSLEIRV